MDDYTPVWTTDRDPDKYHLYEDCYHIVNRKNVYPTTLSEAEGKGLCLCEDCRDR